MKVVIRKDMFLDGTLYRAIKSPVEVPEHLKDKLPKDAKVLTGKIDPPKKEVQQHSLRDFDEARAASDAVIKKTAGK